MHFNDREEIIKLTPQWKGERLPDGRPKVEDKYLDALYGMTLEEVWKPIFVLGYEHQFVGGGENPMLLDWIKNDPRGEEYRDLDWSKEYDLARNGDPNDTQTAL